MIVIEITPLVILGIIMVVAIITVIYTSFRACSEAGLDQMAAECHRERLRRREAAGVDKNEVTE